MKFCGSRQLVFIIFSVYTNSQNWVKLKDTCSAEKSSVTCGEPLLSFKIVVIMKFCRSRQLVYIIFSVYTNSQNWVKLKDICRAEKSSATCGEPLLPFSVIVIMKFCGSRQLVFTIFSVYTNSQKWVKLKDNYRAENGALLVVNLFDLLVLW